MHAFDPDILKPMNSACHGDPVHFIGLGIYDFQLAFGDKLRIQTQSKTLFFIEGRLYEWEQGATKIPVWMLAGQTPDSFELPTPLTLRMNFTSGDYVEFSTDEGPYETTVINFSTGNDNVEMEVY